MQGRSPVLFGASEGVRLLRILAAPIHFVYKLLILCGRAGVRIEGSLLVLRGSC